MPPPTAWVWCFCPQRSCFSAVLPTRGGLRSSCWGSVSGMAKPPPPAGSSLSLSGGFQTLFQTRSQRVGGDASGSLELPRNS